MRFTALLLLLFLTSCASMQGKPRVVIMQHPETMDFQNCDVGRVMFDSDFAANEECVNKLKAEGYIVWGTR